MFVVDVLAWLCPALFVCQYKSMPQSLHTGMSSPQSQLSSVCHIWTRSFRNGLRFTAEPSQATPTAGRYEPVHLPHKTVHMSGRYSLEHNFCLTSGSGFWFHSGTCTVPIHSPKLALFSLDAWVVSVPWLCMQKWHCLQSGTDKQHTARRLGFRFPAGKGPRWGKAALPSWYFKQGLIHRGFRS